jgi:hypothetical protein
MNWSTSGSTGINSASPSSTGTNLGRTPPSDRNRALRTPPSDRSKTGLNSGSTGTTHLSARHSKRYKPLRLLLRNSLFSLPHLQRGTPLRGETIEKRRETRKRRRTLRLSALVPSHPPAHRTHTPRQSQRRSSVPVPSSQSSEIVRRAPRSSENGSAPPLYVFNVRSEREVSQNEEKTA